MHASFFIKILLTLISTYTILLIIKSNHRNNRFKKRLLLRFYNCSIQISLLLTITIHTQHIKHIIYTITLPARHIHNTHKLNRPTYCINKSQLYVHSFAPALYQYIERYCYVIKQRSKHECQIVNYQH